MMDRDRTRRCGAVVHSTAGFTLIELMISLVVGSIALTSVYTVVGGASRVFHEQHRTSRMQTSLRLAMSHLTRDIQRAGYLSTPGIRARGESCTIVNDVGTVPEGGKLVDDASLGGLFAAVAHWAEPTVNLVLNDNNDYTEPNWAGVAPGFATRRTDTLMLLANYETSAEYAGITFVDQGANTNKVEVPATWHAFERDFSHWGTTEPSAGPVLQDHVAIKEAFLVGRAVRIQTKGLGLKHFAIITEVETSSAACNGTGMPWDPICITFEPRVPQRCVADAKSGWIAPVSFIRYRLAPTQVDAASALEEEIAGINIQLQRVEMDPSDPNKPLLNGANAVLLDYATMFNVLFLGNTEHGAGLDDIVNRAVPMNPMAGAPAGEPQWVRSIIVELAVRSPVMDPRFPWPAIPIQFITPLTHFQPWSDGRPGSSRVRYARTEVFLPNVAAGGF